jgi:hypothetical protein
MISNFKYRQYLINNSEDYLKNNNLYCSTNKENNKININFLDSDLKKNYFNYLKNLLYKPLTIVFNKE